MCSIYGYCRISRKQQNIDRQERNILQIYPTACIVKEAYTGTKIAGRAEFEKLLQAVKRGDTIVFDSVSRMSRNAEEGFKLYMEMYIKGVELVFLKEPTISTTTYKQTIAKQFQVDAATGDKKTDNLISAIMDAVQKFMKELAREQIRLAFNQAQKEVDDLHQRTREGIQIARINGKQIGAIPGKKRLSKKAELVKQMIRKYSKDFHGSLTDMDVIKLVGVARGTYYKYKREVVAEEKSSGVI